MRKLALVDRPKPTTYCCGTCGRWAYRDRRNPVAFVCLNDRCSARGIAFSGPAKNPKRESGHV